jgi:hypothetical protein
VIPFDFVVIPPGFPAGPALPFALAFPAAMPAVDEGPDEDGEQGEGGEEEFHFRLHF